MKVGLAGCIAILMIIVGCGQKGEKISGQPAVSDVVPPQAEKQEVWDGTPPAQEAIPDFFADAPETNAFPESIVGLWEAELLVPAIKWAFKFEPDGSIKKIHHTVAGDVNIDQGGVDVNGLEGSYWTFVMGPCEARFIPDTNTVKVKIIVDYFIIKIPDGEIEGRTEDYFEGPLSEDGLTWGTQWRSFSWVRGKPPPDINSVKSESEPLIFVKIDTGNPPKEPPLR